MDRDDVERWIEAYLRAWRTEGPVPTFHLGEALTHRIDLEPRSPSGLESGAGFRTAR